MECAPSARRVNGGILSQEGIQGREGGIKKPCWTSLVSERQSLPAMQERQVPSLGWEDPLEEGTGSHPSVLAWRIPWTEKPGGLQSIGSQRVGHD